MNYLRRSLITLLLLLMTVPALSAGHVTAAEQLSRKDRLEVFDEVWRSINEKYYDSTFNGVNWSQMRERYRPLVNRAEGDDQFYVLLKRMVGELRDAHTRFGTPRERQEREKLQAISAGIYIFEVEGQPAVVSVEPGSDAEKAGVEPGMIVRHIDGEPIEKRIEQARGLIGDSSSDRAVRLRLYRRIIDGEPGTSFRLGLARDDGTTLEVQISRRVVSDAARVIASRLPSGFGYMRLTLWKSPIHKEFESALERLMDAPGLILDLRGNPGGEANEVVKIASLFFPGKVSFGKFIARSGRTIELHTEGEDEDDLYKGTVVILVNEGSGSGSELFTAVMQERGRAVVIGRQSCGCVLGIAKYRKVKGGGELSISELGYVSPTGRKLEGGGVLPDETVALKLADLRQRRDQVILEAENYLRTPVKTSNDQR